MRVVKEGSEAVGHGLDVQELENNDEVFCAKLQSGHFVGQLVGLVWPTIAVQTDHFLGLGPEDGPESAAATLSATVVLTFTPWTKIGIEWGIRAEKQLREEAAIDRSRSIDVWDVKYPERFLSLNKEKSGRANGCKWKRRM